VRQYGTAAQYTLMMEAQGTSETLDHISISTLLVAQQDFIVLLHVNAQQWLPEIP
jgi:hypothetical protein